MVNEGNLLEDSPHEGAAPGDGERGDWPAMERDVKRFPSRLEALMRRFGGHPYEADDLLRFNNVNLDPLTETVRRREACGLALRCVRVAAALGG